MKGAGKGQSGVGSKFPFAPATRRMPSKGPVPAKGSMPSTGVSGGKGGIGGGTKK